MKRFAIFFFLLLLCIAKPIHTYALEDPLSKPNNKFGIHILFDTEISDAAKLVNTHGGDWGYVTIPIQAGDRDLLKWQRFMDNAKAMHIIPIIRLATEGDYFNTKVWRKPNADDVLDFANFLDSLNWPVKNRYIIIFNEVNRGDEWGGAVNPPEYAQLLTYAISLFKSKNANYFILNAGLDNAAPNQAPDYMNEYVYMQQMSAAIPGIFNEIDGFSSHAYPNPGFSQPPSRITTESISSFAFESQLVDSLSLKKLPIFITETGWNGPTVSQQTQAAYYTEAFQTVWANPRIVAVTPFLLRAGVGPFSGFGFMNDGGNETPEYKAYAGFPKQKGQPTIEKTPVQAVLGSEALPMRYFLSEKIPEPTPVLSKPMKTVMKWLFKIK